MLQGSHGIEPQPAALAPQSGPGMLELWIVGGAALVQREELTQHLERAGKLARSMGIPVDELLDMLKRHAQ